MSGAVRSVKKAVKGATKAVKKVASSDIGRIALAVAAPYAMGPAFASMGLAGSVGGSAFLGNALRAGITNLALQGISTGRFDLGQAAKAGAIGGGITTALQGQKFFGPQQRNNLLSNGVTEGSDILYDSDVVNPYAGKSAEQIIAERQVQVAPETTRFTDFSPRVGAGDEQVFGITPGEQTASSTLTSPTTSTAPSGIETISEVDLDVGLPPMPPTVPQAGQDAIFKEYFSAAPITEKVNLAARDFLGFEEAAAFRENPSLKTAVNFAKNNPSLVITSASMLSALSAPKQPEETEFDYEERTALVNQLGGEYLKNTGSSLSGEDFSSIDDWASFFTQRIGRAKGGIMDIPTGEPRRNAGGIMELDYRDEGGFVPIGIKEKADDVPAMLSKNEFVFTADAVKNAGEGDVDKGAQRLYSQMKMLENGGALA
jgi:hypothetical protein